MTAKALPSQTPDIQRRAIDASYESGFNVGRRAGIEKACEIIRALPYSSGNIDILELLTAAKYE
jgi:hypothetical protein